jgi:DNA-binding SARP family transcriptional activator
MSSKPVGTVSTTLNIQLLGEFRLLLGDQPITKLNTPRLQALLTYLILKRAVPQSRQQLAFLFWPESNDAQARTNLRNALHQVRSALPNADDFLFIDAQTIQWRPHAPFTLDLADFAAHLQTAQQRPNSPEAQHALEAALALYRGELLPGCYDDWILPEREQWQQAYFNAQEQLINLLENQQAYRTAIQHAQHLLQQDPLRETTYCRLMQLYALNGDRAAALRTYHACATTMVRELGVEPGPVTQGVYERLLNADTPAPATASLRTLSPLVGRESAWAHLQAAWQQAQAGQPHLLLLAGEAGIGKTRMAEELIDWAIRQGFAALMAHCYAVGGQLAYTPVQEWLRSSLFQRARREVAPVWASEVAHLLPELLSERPGLPMPPPLTEAWQRQRLFEALAHLLFQGAPALLLVLDDIQWCDSDTLDWLQYLLRAFPKAQLLVVGTLRRVEQANNLALQGFIVNLTRTGQLSEVELSRLDAQASAALAANLQGQPLSPDSALRIYRESEGIPLFIVEMMRAERGGRGERGRRGAGELGSGGEPTALTPLLPHSPTPVQAPLPPKVLSAIQARLLYLSPAALELARVAAVIGRAFTADVLAQASGNDEDTLVQGLDELWQQQVIREQRAGQLDAERYDFSHDKIREVVYASLSPIRRRFLHRRVAQALEILHADQPDAVAGQIALHYERAEQIALALPYYQRAAHFAHRISAQQEAMNYLPWCRPRWSVTAKSWPCRALLGLCCWQPKAMPPQKWNKLFSALGFCVSR